MAFEVDKDEYTEKDRKVKRPDYGEKDNKIKEKSESLSHSIPIQSGLFGQQEHV